MIQEFHAESCETPKVKKMRPLRTPKVFRFPTVDRDPVDVGSRPLLESLGDKAGGDDEPDGFQIILSLLGSVIILSMVEVIEYRLII